MVSYPGQELLKQRRLLGPRACDFCVDQNVLACLSKDRRNSAGCDLLPYPTAANVGQNYLLELRNRHRHEQPLDVPLHKEFTEGVFARTSQAGAKARTAIRLRRPISSNRLGAPTLCLLIRNQAQERTNGGFGTVRISCLIARCQC